MIEFTEIFERIKDFYREKKILAIAITIVVGLFFLGLIAFTVQALNPEKEKPAVSEELPLVPDQKIITPEGPSIPDGYALTREPHDKWTEDEAAEYFTLPDQNTLDKLESANDKLVDDILGDAP
ncbi:MAG: hypothetical protein J6Y36_04120 [Treponema sp.]|uniref:hypothetical protein n=1 Tax=Treponema sp. TaxID=166 RepID=UPI001B4719CE|nr:hypothetical protein [Treponema sp.]MBP5402326.1 hypothetical protein [Treponema sp.]MBR5933175.1 hypothetical protein [Treponema sp.]